MANLIRRDPVYTEEILEPHELTPYLNGKCVVRRLYNSVEKSFVTGPEQVRVQYARRFAVRPSARTSLLVGIFQEHNDSSPRTVYRVISKSMERIWPF